MSDRDLWVSKRAERVQAFAGWGTNVVDYVSADGGKDVAVAVDVHDMAAMEKAFASPEIAAAKKAHGVIEPVIIHVEKS